jgi:hypothetical protein
VYSRKISKVVLESQNYYDKNFAPIVSNIIRRSESLLGEENSVVIEATRTANFARTNFITMLEMVSLLQKLLNEMFLR